MSMDTPWPDPRFRELTPTLLASLSADDVGGAIAQHVHLHAESHADEPHSGIAQLAEGVQAVYTTWLVDNEVNNGGFNQFFYNQHGTLAGAALRGYELLGTEEY